MIINMKAFYFRIDATFDDGIARYINDSATNYNLRVKLQDIGDRYRRPVFITTRDIEPHEELTYNYGPGSYPWRCTPEQVGQCFIKNIIIILPSDF